jgi:hypothetical protein
MPHRLHSPIFPNRWELIKANMVVHAHELHPRDEEKHKQLIIKLLCMSEPHKVKAESITWEIWGQIVQSVHDHAMVQHPHDREKSHKLELKLLGYG